MSMAKFILVSVIMEFKYNDFLISDDQSLIQVERVYELLKTAYWAENWITKEIVALSVKNSFCFGIYKDAVLIGFARCVTDYSTLYYLADVVINNNYRGQGLGKELTKFITEHEMFSPLLGVIETKDAHGLYEKYGFKTSKGFAMRKDPR
jgi:ribosomal protein S18 acetylase RimI-like enzyme